jgi:hypothetical protein
MRRPKLTVADMRREKSVVEGIQGVRIRTTKATAKHRHVYWKLGCIDGDRNIGGNTRCPARIANAAHDQSAECAVTCPNDITFRRAWVVVVHAARAIRAVSARD